MRLPCRFCGEHFNGVRHSDSWTELDGRHHWIVSPSGLLSGERKEVTKKPALEAISPDDFFDIDPEVLPETAVQPLDESVEEVLEN
jgi:hypothetical protein